MRFHDTFSSTRMDIWKKSGFESGRATGARLDAPGRRPRHSDSWRRPIALTSSLIDGLHWRPAQVLIVEWIHWRRSSLSLAGGIILFP